MKKSTSRVLALVWGAVMIAVLSSTLTLLFTGRSTGAARWVSEAQYEMIERYGKLDAVRGSLMNEYYQPLDEDALMLGAIRGMTGAVGDAYTFYYTPEELAREAENERGEYHGIGVLIARNAEGLIEVLRVYDDTPAVDAGLEVGDLIIGVDGSEIGVDGHSYNDAVAQIRGEAGTEVRLTIRRSGERFDVTVKRADVNVDYAEYRMLDGGIGYVSISQFTGNAQDKFDEAIDFFRREGARGMVIDVRSNPGGLLNEVNHIVDRILPEGVIVYMQDRDGKRTDYYSDAELYDVPVAVLINDMSASASEILAASVQALERGVVVGVTSYGKGIVQTLKTYEDGSGMQLTTSSYYDANGRSIHGVGVTPDIEVALVGDRVPLEPDPLSDNQLAAAIEALRETIDKAE